MTDGTLTVTPDIAVVGSVHQDLIVRVPELPRPGETVLGHQHFRAPGGKGANQAVAASRLGAQVAMIGQVGDDPDGGALRECLRSEGIEVAGVAIDPDHATGLAVVTVDDAGENAIVVSPGASGALSAEQVGRHADLLARSQVTLLQLEVDLAAVESAAQRSSGIVVLNPAPATELSDRLLGCVDVLVPNRDELAMLCGIEGGLDDLDEVEEAARRLADGRAVVVTLGADGALLVHGEVAEHVPAPTVSTVDTTGAGDTLCGALAVRLAGGATLLDALPWAVRAAALSTTRAGAQPSLPTLDEVERFTG